MEGLRGLGGVGYLPITSAFNLSRGGRVGHRAAARHHHVLRGALDGQLAAHLELAAAQRLDGAAGKAGLRELRGVEPLGLGHLAIDLGGAEAGAAGLDGEGHAAGLGLLGVEGDSCGPLLELAFHRHAHLLADEADLALRGHHLLGPGRGGDQERACEGQTGSCHRESQG